MSLIFTTPFAPRTHGLHEDTNLITTFTLDRLGRQTAVSDPLGNVTARTYYKNSAAWFLTDPELVVTQHRFDRVGRLTTVVTGWQDNGEDPTLWVWSVPNTRWQKSDGTPIAHGTNNDTNIISLCRRSTTSQGG